MRDFANQSRVDLARIFAEGGEFSEWGTYRSVAGDASRVRMILIEDEGGMEARRDGVVVRDELRAYVIHGDGGLAAVEVRGQIEREADGVTWAVTSARRQGTCWVIRGERIRPVEKSREGWRR